MNTSSHIKLYYIIHSGLQVVTCKNDKFHTKTSEAIRPVQTAVKFKSTYSYSLHHAARIQ